MSKETVFFSYSRDDTEFVLNLAKNLRQAGAKVWLDQLDISPGTRWDKAIENALTESKVLLVILSKTSVDSDNVLDEVSFALEEGKTVVPVLLEDCEIPFRLRRLQYADFTENREKGIQTLIHALHLDAEVASKLSGLAEYEINATSEKEIIEAKKIKETIESQKTPVPGKKTIIEPETVHFEKAGQLPEQEMFETKTPSSFTPKNTEATQPKNKKIIVGLIAVIILATAVWSVTFFIVDEDTKWFNDTMQRNTVQDFEFYISRFPEGKYIDQARDSIYAKDSRDKRKKEQELKEKEKEAWKKAVSDENVEGYQSYINNYPNGDYITEARQKIDDFSENIENVRQDNEAWNVAVSLRSVTAFLDYYTNQAILGFHRDEALQKINESGKKGWLYCGRFSGEFMTESIFDLVWRGGNFSPKDILKSQDIVMLKANESARKTYRNPDNRNSNTVNSALLNKGLKAYVLAVEKEGNALIVQIVY